MMKTITMALFLCLLTACGKKAEQRTPMSYAFDKMPTSSKSDYDLEDIRKSGELVVATISGPETYYEHHGVSLGFHYALIENFAESEGLKVRIEIASDTISLLNLLKTGEADIAAFPLTRQAVQEEGLTAVTSNEKRQKTWAIKNSSKELAKAIKAWYKKDKEIEIRKRIAERSKKSRRIRNKPRAVYLSRSRGIISIYDDLFKQASSITGWDWKLLAAQCYQESAFDPNATSWAGAEGLMQLMHGTAQELGLTPAEINHPDKNVFAAARYIKKLNGSFADIRDNGERIKFILAAYNGGALHIRDAMALARKYGKNAHLWDDVVQFVLGLQNPQYYRDPIVKRGYMIGSETADYVASVLERWRGYGGNIAYHPSFATETPQSNGQVLPQKNIRAIRKNKYSSGVRILHPEDPELHQMNISSQ